MESLSLITGAFTPVNLDLERATEKDALIYSCCREIHNKGEYVNVDLVRRFENINRATKNIFMGIEALGISLKGLSENIAYINDAITYMDRCCTLTTQKNHSNDSPIIFARRIRKLKRLITQQHHFRELSLSMEDEGYIITECLPSKEQNDLEEVMKEAMHRIKRVTNIIDQAILPSLTMFKRYTEDFSKMSEFREIQSELRAISSGKELLNAYTLLKKNLIGLDVTTPFKEARQSIACGVFFQKEHKNIYNLAYVNRYFTLKCMAPQLHTPHRIKIDTALVFEKRYIKGATIDPLAVTRWHTAHDYEDGKEYRAHRKSRTLRIRSK